MKADRLHVVFRPNEVTVLARSGSKTLREYHLPSRASRKRLDRLFGRRIDEGRARIGFSESGDTGGIVIGR